MITLRRPKGFPRQAKTAHVPAPLGGLNTISQGTDMPATDLVLSYNVMSSELGLRSRLGWREWCTNLAGEQVRTIIPYTGSTPDGSSNRLFACTRSGIWDCSASSASPSRVVTFAIQNDDSGWGASSVFVTLGVPLETAVVAVLIFRFAYYAVPFLISLAFFRGMLSATGTLPLATHPHTG